MFWEPLRSSNDEQLAAPSRTWCWVARHAKRTIRLRPPSSAIGPKRKKPNEKQLPRIAEELSIRAGVIQPLQGAEDFAELADRGMGFAHSAVADRRLGRGSIQVAPNTFVRRSKISSAMK